MRSFLDRYDGAIVSDDTIPEPPPGSGVTLTAEDRRPVQYKIRINLARVNVARLPAQGAAAGLTGIYEFSSEDGRRTFGGILDARAAGFRVSRDYVYEASQAFPFPLFKSDERRTTPGPPPVFKDPLNPTAYPDFGATGNASNVSLAWQFIAAHGVQRRTSVAIIDSGFYLDPARTERGGQTVTSRRLLGGHVQHDFDFKRRIRGRYQLREAVRSTKPLLVAWNRIRGRGDGYRQQPSRRDGHAADRLRTRSAAGEWHQSPAKQRDSNGHRLGVRTSCR